MLCVCVTVVTAHLFLSEEGSVGLRPPGSAHGQWQVNPSLWVWIRRESDVPTSRENDGEVVLRCSSSLCWSTKETFQIFTAPFVLSVIISVFWKASVCEMSLHTSLRLLSCRAWLVLPDRWQLHGSPGQAASVRLLSQTNWIMLLNLTCCWNVRGEAPQRNTHNGCTAFLSPLHVFHVLPV